MKVEGIRRNLTPCKGFPWQAVNLPDPLTRALAWWIAAEMIRRHPDEVRVIETHPGGGQYDCVSLYRRDADDSLVVHLNLQGHLTHQSWFSNSDSYPDSGVADPRFNWLGVLASEDRRRYVIEALEGVSGFVSPNLTPPTTSTSIRPRLIARFALAVAITTRTWHIRNAVHDGSGMWSGVNDRVRDIKGPRFESLKSDLLGEPHYRYWFVLNHKHEADAVVDVELGVAWRRERPDLAHHLMDLNTAYDSRIDRAMADVFPAVE